MSHLFVAQETSTGSASSNQQPPRRPARRPAGAEPAELPRTGGLTPQQVVGHIIELNPTASADFLAQFEPASLSLYLEHLLASQEPRGRGSSWRRPGDTPAIVCVERTRA